MKKKISGELLHALKQNSGHFIGLAVSYNANLRKYFCNMQ